MSDSGEFQDSESIGSGKLSHVPSQLTIVASLERILSRDSSLRSDTWNVSNTSENFFDSARVILDSSSTLYQDMLHSLNESATCELPVRQSTSKSVARSQARNQETIPTSRFARRSSTMIFFFPAEGPQNYMTDQQRLQISELQFDKISIVSEEMLWIKEVEMDDSVDDLKS